MAQFGLSSLKVIYYSEQLFRTSIIRTPTTSLKTSIKTITNLSDTNCLEIHGASLYASWGSLMKEDYLVTL
ncbi:hypothetical protein D0887_27975 (plasmid) [Klebsiella pneumoniae]|nr:hypothetical protein D0887_27975 [Klebsiella pneumoniae]